MKKLINTIEKTFAAVGFAEAGEFNGAVEFMDSNYSVAAKARKKTELNWFDRVFGAAAFAEQGCHEMALDYLKEKPAGRRRRKEDLYTFLDSVGLRNVQVNYGVVSV